MGKQITKQDILAAIRRTAENGGVPLRRGTFLKETGINEYTYTKFWSTFGEAQREAGFSPNSLQVPHSEQHLLESISTLIRQLGKWPTGADFRVKRNQDSNFPSSKSFRRFGHKVDLARIVYEHAEQAGYNDVVKICESVLLSSEDRERVNAPESRELGEVYLFKSGRYYKIGKTNNTVRRGSEIRIQLPERIDLIHSIKTDDPNGIENYWHKRFESKQMNGE